MTRTLTPGLSACRSACVGTKRSPRRARGFSLIELIVTISIVAILLAVALPSFVDTITRNRIAGAANDFVAGLNYARTEALRRNGSAGVCTSLDGVTCDGTWNDKWIVFSGDSKNPTVLRASEFSPKDSFTAQQATTLIEFDARGMLVGTPDVFELKPESCAAGKPMRRVFSLRQTGSLSVSKADCT